MHNVIPFPQLVNCPSPLLDAIEQLRDEVSNIQASVKPGQTVDFAKIERLIDEKTNPIARCAKAVLLADLQPESETIRYHGELYKQCKSTSMGRYYTMQGWVELQRHLYRRCGVRNGATIDPIALRAGLIVGRATPNAAKTAVYLAQALPSREGDELCTQLGILPGARSVRYKLALQLGAYWKEHADVIEECWIEDFEICLLYTSDAADDIQCVDLCGRRIITKHKYLTAADDQMTAHVSNAGHSS